jgi:hypothetical protein
MKKLKYEEQDCLIDGDDMELYIHEKAREATWKLYEDDEEMLGHDLFCFAITNWKMSHREEMEGFRKEYLKKVQISA